MSARFSWQTLRHGTAVARADIPEVAPADLVPALREAREDGARLANFFGHRTAPGALSLYAIVARESEGCYAVIRSELRGAPPLTWQSVTPAWPAAQAFEREIAEQYGAVPAGHPWLKPLRYHPTADGSPAPWGPFRADVPIPGDYPFYRVEGDEVHEVAVGPVHAGVIEPGHFRFQCHGEDVLHLEIVLGYQHRGAEPLILHPNPARAAAVVETIAGDSSIAHASAYAGALEGLADVEPSSRANMVRGVALELERLANHVGDLGALSLDVGFLPCASYLGRLRGDFLNLTADICGNRFGRNLVRPGGVLFDIQPALAKTMVEKLDKFQRELLPVLDLLFASSSVLSRFEGTGALRRETAEEIGLVGPAARACGVDRDVRNDHPTGVFRFFAVPVASEMSGDVYARAAVRWVEIQRSIIFLRDVLSGTWEGEMRRPLAALKPDALAIGVSEGWRGEVMHAVLTDAAGKIAHVKAKDPSIHNWFGLALALRGVAISDFPICNKSFNLSYAGHDL